MTNDQQSLDNIDKIYILCFSADSVFQKVVARFHFCVVKGFVFRKSKYGVEMEMIGKIVCYIHWY